MTDRRGPSGPLAGRSDPDGGALTDAGTRWRASDAEREATLSRLREGLAAGRVTLEEFSERTEATLAARYREELTALVADLPPGGPELADLPRAPRRLPSPRRRGEGLGLHVALLGSSSRSGRWRARSREVALAVLGEVTVDLRRATAEVDELTLFVVAFMGAVRVVVPEGMDVDVVGLPILAHKEARLSSSPPVVGLPRLRVRALPILGSLEVRARRERRLWQRF